MSGPVELTQSLMRCVVLPHAGGGLAGWWHDGIPLLRPLRPEDWRAPEPTSLAAFPLVPFSNRIGNAEFGWNDQTIKLRRNHPTEPHALHGVGWQRPWEVARVDTNEAVLVLDHPGDAFWPWPFRCVQVIRLSNQALLIEMRTTNLASEPVPLSAGFHPYFPYANAEVRLDAEAVWLSQQGNLPENRVMPAGDLDLSRAAAIALREIDNCYDRVAWPATIGWAQREFTIAIAGSEELACAVVYISAAADALCIEPVAHTNNALNLTAGIPVPVLAPGESRTVKIEMTLRHSDAGVAASAP